MGRPKVPLIDRDVAISTALDIIDREGLEALSIRRLGKELGVNGASLYHHFEDKEAILRGVRRLIRDEHGLLLRSSKSAKWQDYVIKSVTRNRTALLRHPNAAPLMSPVRLSPSSQVQRDFLVRKMLEDGVPLHFTFAIIDSVETLAWGSALINPQQLQPKQRLALSPDTDAPSLKASVKAAQRTAERLFHLELQALLAGWTALIVEERSQA